MKKTPFKNGDIRQVYPGGPHLFNTAEEARRFITNDRKGPRGKRRDMEEDDDDEDEDPKFFAICISNGEALRWYRLHGQTEVKIESNAHEAKLGKILEDLAPEEIRMLKTLIGST